MKTKLPAALTVVAAVATLLVPAASAKFGLTVAVAPKRPTVGTPARVVLRTEIALARVHGIRLFAVGPWRRNLGQAFFEVRLARANPHLLTGRIRFPYPGRWHLNVPPPHASPSLDVWVTVRPRS